MNEAKFVTELGSMLKSHGCLWHKFRDRQKCQYCGKLVYKTDNLPYDGQAIFYGRAIPIEAKYARKSFALNEIRPNQRQGMSEWVKAQASPAWLALCMGHKRVNVNSDLRRKAWLIPWSAWLMVEKKLINNDLRSLAYSAEFRLRKDVKWANALRLLFDYELKWHKWDTGKSNWSIPLHHVFNEHYGDVHY
ncbi:MAG: hypothetical protein QGF64_04770 [Candidatus Poseidoniia archaeon]|jgi:hypothetical protein|nr:hypothetical protein [Candidatus Poseidoniia archaeon]